MGDEPAFQAGTGRRTVVATSIGTFVEGYDLALYGYFAVILAGQFFPSDDPAAALLATFGIFALGFAARPVGGMFFGHIGDRVGRRTAVVGSILLMAVSTVGIAMLPTYGQVGVLASVLLLACRLLQGFSVGGEVAGGNVFVLEHAATGWAGRAVAANTAAGFMGIACAAAVSLLMATMLGAQQLASWGWRIPFAAAAPLALIGVYLRLRVLESPEFRAAGTPRRRFPLGHAIRTAGPNMMVYAGFAAMVMLGTYLVFGYLPSHLTQVTGLSTTQSFAVILTAVTALGVGAVLGGILVDRTSPRVAATSCAIAIGVTAQPAFLIIQQGAVVSAILGPVPWAIFLGVGGVVAASLALHLFPTPIRYTASAFALNITGAVFAGTAPYLSTWLIDTTGNPTAPGLYLTSVAIVGLSVAFFAVPRYATRHRPPTDHAIAS
jgi:MHS family proline/betaine transporter-like MFS transporter